MSDGWRVVHTRGSHRQYHHANKPGTVTKAGHLNADVPKGMWLSILKQAGLREAKR